MFIVWKINKDGVVGGLCVIWYVWSFSKVYWLNKCVFINLFDIFVNKYMYEVNVEFCLFDYICVWEW